MRSRALLFVFALMMSAAAEAQMMWQPTELPLVTADNETWYRAGNAVEWPPDREPHAAERGQLRENRLIGHVVADENRSAAGKRRLRHQPANRRTFADARALDFKQSLAEEHFQRALDWTRRQGVLSMELRCAVGLAQLWHARGQTAAARALLAPVYGRFTEGFATPELQAARALLDRLG